MRKEIKYIITALILIGSLLMTGCNDSDPEKVLSETDKVEIGKILEDMESDVEILLFISEKDCFGCQKTEILMSELEQITDKISVKVFDKETNSDLSIKYDIELVPAIVIIGKEDYGIKHYGFPGGRIFVPFIEAIILSSMKKPNISEDLQRKINNIDDPVEVKILVTSTCPYCPDMVRYAYRYSILSENIYSVSIMANEFEEYTGKYNIRGVPTMIFNENFIRDGQIGEEEFLNYIVVS